MGERPRQTELSFGVAEAIHLLLEAEYQEGWRDVDRMIRRVKDLSAYALEQVEILPQREGSELLGLAIFFDRQRHFLASPSVQSSSVFIDGRGYPKEPVQS